ncbi:dienelactone hydrolase family protein [Pseudokineococcus sp. 1T1Z-3]|uniref:dienelactone hydrolase family protein n=1 Tax=Pseudokineococcus sp. 1T1Z-3 TaxID=3132745 RepID=UPI0030B692AE
MKSFDAEAVERQVDDLASTFSGPVVYAGISWGVTHAQRLPQTHPGARGALLFEACYRLGEDNFGAWPTGLPVQVHGMDQDQFFALEGDLDAARDLAATAGADTGEVFTYPGDQHLFVDSTLPSYDPTAAAAAIARARNLLSRM